LGLSNYIIE